VDAGDAISRQVERIAGSALSPEVGMLSGPRQIGRSELRHGDDLTHLQPAEEDMEVRRATVVTQSSLLAQTATEPPEEEEEIPPPHPLAEEMPLRRTCLAEDRPPVRRAGSCPGI